MTKRIAAALFVMIAVTAPALAVLGVGDVVFDPSVFAKTVDELTQLKNEYNQIVETYHVIESQYQQMQWMAQQDPVNMLTRYGAPATPWTPSQATNTYGTTGAWTAGVNSGLNASGAYGSAIQPLGTYGAALGNIPADQLSRLQTNYGTVELADGANIAALQTIGELRNNAIDVDAAIANLQANSLSSDPGMNTEIAVLNKINAANVIALRNGQDANKILVALAEQQMLQAKRERDAEAQAFNEHIGFMTNAQNLMNAQSANASASMLAWEMP